MIVLSSCDGCAIVHSNEADAHSLAVSNPLHLMCDRIKAHGIQVFSSNQTTLGEIASRAAEDYEADIEIYSRGECLRDAGDLKNWPE